MAFKKDHAGQHDIAALRKRGNDKQDKDLLKPARGLLIMLGSCVAFLAFLSLLTIAVHFVML